MFSLPLILKPLLRKKLTVGLLALQIALITMLLSNLTHILNELDNYYNEDSGIDDKYLFSFTLRIPPEQKNILLIDGLRDLVAINHIPGVKHIASINAIPFDRDGQVVVSNFTTSLEPNTSKVPYVRGNVSPNAFITMGLNLLAGRQFDNNDMALTAKSQPNVIIITHALAKALFGDNKSAIGKVVYEGNKPYEIIGVTADWKGFIPQIYRPESTAFFPEYNEFNKEFRYLIRTASPELRTEVIHAVTHYISTKYPRGLIFYADKLDEVPGKYMNRSLIMLFTLITLVLTLASIVAIAGQAYFSVHQRRKQLGVLRALGATRGKLILQILLENAAIVLIGLGLGSALSILLSQLIYRSSDIAALSPTFLFFTAASIFIVCLLSAAVPAWQAGKISPSLATRTL